MAVFLSSAEFARARKLSEQRVRQLLAAGKVAGTFRVGARWAIPADAAIRRTPRLDEPKARENLERLIRAARTFGAQCKAFATGLSPARRRR